MAARGATMLRSLIPARLKGHKVFHCGRTLGLLWVRDMSQPTTTFLLTQPYPRLTRVSHGWTGALCHSSGNVMGVTMLALIPSVFHSLPAFKPLNVLLRESNVYVVTFTFVRWVLYFSSMFQVLKVCLALLPRSCTFWVNAVTNMCPCSVIFPRPWSIIHLGCHGVFRDYIFSGCSIISSSPLTPVEVWVIVSYCFQMPH